MHLNELNTGRIGYVNAAVRRGNHGNAFVGGFLNNDLVGNPIYVPHVDFLSAHIATRFGSIPAPFRRFFEVFYDDEQNVQRPAELEV